MKIRLELHDEILARTARGESTRAVAKWLKSTHGLKVSHVSVARIVARHRTERREIAQHIVREHIEKTLPSDLDELGKLRAGHRRLARLTLRNALKAPTTAAVDAATKAMALVERSEESNRKSLGIDTPEPVISDLFGFLATVFVAGDAPRAPASLPST
jgi:hypothetical protein